MQVDLDELQHATHVELLRRIKSTELVDLALVEATVNELAPLLDAQIARQVATRVLAAVNGLGALEPLLSDDRTTDVMVVGGRGVWIENAGQLHRTDVEIDDSEVARLIERIVAPLGLRIDRSSPMVDARLGDGSRVNAIVPPLAVDGPCLTIRRFGARHVELDQIAQPDVASLLRAAVGEYRNIVISGGTGAGKTTLLNALASFISDEERVITIEDAAELKLPITHVVRLEARPANSEGVGRVQLRDLVRNALRMRPDRIIVGEVRGDEALDMLQAMNTGHEGSMSTCHANTPNDALRRIETMVLMGGIDLPLVAVRQQISASIDLVVQIARGESGVRQVVDVSEVVDVDGVPVARQLADQHRVLMPLSRPRRRQVASNA